jgi:uncharacterized protein (TIGR00299 family) protein
VLYLECRSGAAGDMILGALLDAGLPADALRDALGSLGVEAELHIDKVLRAGVTATHFRVTEKAVPVHAHHGHSHAHQDHHDDSHHHEHGGHRSLKEITHLIGHSALSAAGKVRATALFKQLAEVEAAIHGIPVERVHLHEVGALDSIIDVVGAVFAFEWFGIDDIVSSPLNVGGGTVEIAHGTFPVPAPATVKLLTGVSVYSSGAQMELVTPTGALLVANYAKSFGPMPAMTIAAAGYGAGTADRPGVPNVLRVVIGERTADGADPPAAGSVLKIECEIDDMSPQLFGPVSDRLFAAGALDVFLTPVQMKKGRPGTLLTALVPADRREAICDVLFRETTTIGVRGEQVWRETLDREWVDVSVTGGRVRIKVARRRGEILNAIPEFDDCLRIAEATGTPVKTVQADATRAWLDRSRR